MAGGDNGDVTLGGEGHGGRVAFGAFRSRLEGPGVCMHGEEKVF